MDPNRFDSIAARLATHRAGRRAIMAAAGAGIGAASLGAADIRLTMAQATPTAEDPLPDTV